MDKLQLTIRLRVQIAKSWQLYLVKKIKAAVARFYISTENRIIPIYVDNQKQNENVKLVTKSPTRI